MRADAKRSVTRPTPTPAVAAPKAPADNKRTAAGVVRVLCVDDHAVLVEGLKAQFAIAGDIEVVGRLASAARLVDEVDSLKPHVVLMDIEMPGPDAFETAERLKASHPSVRIIVLSAHIRDAFITASFSAGVCAYFAKSDELDDIVSGIHEVVRHKAGTFLLGPKVRERCKPPSGKRASAKDRNRDASGDQPETGAATLMGTLSAREIEILRLIGKGHSRVLIASQLCRSVKTIDGHQDRMLKKLGIASRADLMRYAIREGLAQA